MKKKIRPRNPIARAMLEQGSFDWRFTRNNTIDRKAIKMHYVIKNFQKTPKLKRTIQSKYDSKKIQQQKVKLARYAKHTLRRRVA